MGVASLYRSPHCKMKVDAISDGFLVNNTNGIMKAYYFEDSIMFSSLCEGFYNSHFFQDKTDEDFDDSFFV